MGGVQRGGLFPDKLSGVVIRQYAKCGRPDCRCAQGELHGPYFYRFWRDWEGKQHKEYVRRSETERARAACEVQQQELREARKVLALGRQAVKACARKKSGAPKSLGVD